MQNRSTRGFTVLELVVTLGVMAVIAGIAIPGIRQDTDRLLDTAQLAVQDAVSYAQDQAEQTGVPHGVHFASGSPLFGVVNGVVGAGGPVIDPLTRQNYVIDLREPGQPQGVDLSFVNTNGNPVVAFDESGTLLVNGSLTISTGSESRTLTLNPVTNQLYDPNEDEADNVGLLQF